MPYLYVIEQGAVVRKAGERVVVCKERQELLDVPIHKVDGIMVFGNVGITTPALSVLLDRGVEVALFTRRGRLKGQLTPVKSKNILLRMEQFRRYQDANFRLGMSRTIVTAKIWNSLTLVRQFLGNHPDVDCRAEVVHLEEQLQRAQHAMTLAESTGQEGAAGRAYFEAFGKMCLGALAFGGRRRRPPTDPVNALLSFGYVLVFNEIQSLLDGMGFDPYIGFFHEVDYGRASLAADLLEEFRQPIVDRLVLRLVNLRIVQAEDFTRDPLGGGVRLALGSLKTFFVHYEEMMNKEAVRASDGRQHSYRRCIRVQAEALARTVADPLIPYVPFRLGPAPEYPQG